MDIGAIWRDIYEQRRTVPVKAIGAVDVALWDLAGKVAGLPIHRMLGTCREQVPAYASSAWLPTPEAYVEEALLVRSLGMTAYKIHPHGSPKPDVEICRAVREAVGDSMVLMLDVTRGYCYEDVIRVNHFCRLRQWILPV